MATQLELRADEIEFVRLTPGSVILTMLLPPAARDEAIEQLGTGSNAIAGYKVLEVVATDMTRQTLAAEPPPPPAPTRLGQPPPPPQSYSYGGRTRNVDNSVQQQAQRQQEKEEQEGGGGFLVTATVVLVALVCCVVVGVAYEMFDGKEKGMVCALKAEEKL